MTSPTEALSVPAKALERFRAAAGIFDLYDKVSIQTVSQIVMIGMVTLSSIVHILLRLNLIN